MSDIWECPNCKYRIRGVVLFSVRYDYGCPKCHCPFANFNKIKEGRKIMFNKWEKVRDYFKCIGIDKDVTRKQYLADMASIYGIRKVTCDNCRCILMTAGYLMRVKRGIYKKIKCIPYYLTYMQARQEAYGGK